MCTTVVCPSNLLKKNTNTTDKKWKRLIFNTNPKIALAAIGISLVFSLSIAVNEDIFGISNNVYAQVHQQQNDSPTSANKITIQLNSIKFVPLTDTNFNQLKVLVDYQTNDPSAVNTPMDGTMKVSLPDGTPLKTSSIQKGYVVGQSGIIQFATSFEDKTIQSVNADVYLTDTLGTEKISNVLAINASLAK